MGYIKDWQAYYRFQACSVCLYAVVYKVDGKDLQGILLYYGVFQYVWYIAMFIMCNSAVWALPLVAPWQPALWTFSIFIALCLIQLTLNVLPAGSSTSLYDCMAHFWHLWNLWADLSADSMEGGQERADLGLWKLNSVFLAGGDHAFSQEGSRLGRKLQLVPQGNHRPREAS